MGAYKVGAKPSVERDLRNVPANFVKRIDSAIEKLENDPLPSGVVKLAGAERTYRVRVGDLPDYL
jgi:mRNA-degrading endonuclease RelE of RelBE toxin-antitoxin system